MGAILWVSDAPFVPPAPSEPTIAIPAFAHPGQALTPAPRANDLGPDALPPGIGQIAPEPAPRIVVHVDRVRPLTDKPAETFAERKAARTASERRRREAAREIE